MNTKLILYALLALFSFLTCDLEEPQPNAQIYHGGVYIQCDVGPNYYFALDSLIANCANADSFEVALPALQTCFYDNNPALSADSTVYDFVVSRSLSDWQVMDFAVADSSVQVDAIPFIVIDNDVLSPGSLPFYGAYRATWPGKVLNVYILNRYQGGCLHDEVVWHLEME